MRTIWICALLVGAGVALASHSSAPGHSDPQREMRPSKISDADQSPTDSDTTLQTGTDVYVYKTPMDYNSNNMFWFLSITSHLNILNITDIAINRGNCEFKYPEGKTYLLKFGQNMKINVTNCDPIEVVIKADQGTYKANLGE